MHRHAWHGRDNKSRVRKGRIGRRHNQRGSGEGRGSDSKRPCRPCWVIPGRTVGCYFVGQRGSLSGFKSE